MEINEDDLERVACIKDGISDVCDGCSVVDAIRAMQVLCFEMTGDTLAANHPELTKEELAYGITHIMQELVGQALVMGPVLEKHYQKIED